MPFGETGLAGAAGQLVHRLKQVQINNMAGPSAPSSQTIHHKLHLAEEAVFLGARRPLKAQINSADGPCPPL